MRMEQLALAPDPRVIDERGKREQTNPGPPTGLRTSFIHREAPTVDASRGHDDRRIT
jgi:hypothetical protein